MTSLGPQEGRLFALSPDSHVLQSGCDGGSCDYAWFDADGGPGVRGERWSTFNSRSVSPDGRRLLVQEDAVETLCPRGDGLESVVRTGTMKLLDLWTGEPLLEEPGLRTNVWDHNPFGGHGRWFAVSPLEASECDGKEWAYRATAAPFGAAPGVDAETFLEDELADGRAIAWRGDALGVLHPGVAGSFQAVGTALVDGGRFGDTVHTWSGSPVRAVDSYALADGHRSRWELPVAERDWVYVAASGRWVVACGHPAPVRRCLVHDTRGVRPDLPLEVDYQSPDWLALAGAGDLLLFRAPGEGRPSRLDLLEGEVTPLPPASGALLTIATGGAALVRDGRALWLVERRHVEQLADDLHDLVYLEGPRLRDDVPQRTLLVLLRVSTSGGEHRLSVYHPGQRRLVALTDGLFLHPEFQTPYVATRGCGVPWVARSAGDPVESVFQPARQFHFTEFLAGLGKVRLWLMPVDLLAPPRLVAELPAGDCTAPFVSADGSVVAFEEAPDPGGPVTLWRGALTSP